MYVLSRLAYALVKHGMKNAPLRMASSMAARQSDPGLMLSRSVHATMPARAQLLCELTDHVEVLAHVGKKHVRHLPGRCRHRRSLLNGCFSRSAGVVYWPARIRSSRRLRSSKGMSPLLSIVIQPL